MNQFLKNLQAFISNLSSYLNTMPKEPPKDPLDELQRVPPTPPVVPQDESKPDCGLYVPETEPETLKWDTPQNVRHSVRVMCDNAGLSVEAKNIITACIKQESNFIPKAVGKTNSNGTTDYGLCQYNNGRNRKTGAYYWIGPGADFANIAEVLNDPEKNVRIMIREYKKGNIKLWSSYSTGAYKRWLY